VVTANGFVEALRKLRYARSGGRAEALFRVAFATVLLIQLLWLRGDLQLFYSTESPSPPLPSIAALYTPTLVTLAFWLWLAATVLLLVGLCTRAAAIACFLGCFHFFVFRQTAAAHATEWLVPGMAFHVMLLPSNRYLALDRRIFSSPQSPDVPAWPLRLAQLSVAFFYLTAGTSKLGDPVWQRGKGFFMTFANPILSHWDLSGVATLPVVSPCIGYGVMLWECAMPLLLLFRRTRLFAVASALVFLVIIDVDLPVGWFAWFCIANLLVFVDDLPWPQTLLSRWPWLAAPSVAPAIAAGRRRWQDVLVTAFLAFHLASFAWLQVAYGFFAKGRYGIGMRLLTTPVLGSYGYGIANVRFYSLWPSVMFYRLHVVSLEVTPRGSAPVPLPPLGPDGRPNIGWLASRNVREVEMVGAGLTHSGWKRYFDAVAQRYARESGACPEKISAYMLTVEPGSFGRDLRRGRVALQESKQLDCNVAR
jgi:hypothetical protein